MPTDIHKNNIQQDAWHSLKAFTTARIALGKTGTAIPLKEVLEFKLAFAHARDAVYSLLDTKQLSAELEEFKLPVHFLQSNADNRATYLQRPDLGRRLNEESKNKLHTISNETYDIAIILADGLSALAVNKNTLPLLKLLIPSLQQYNLAPISVVQNARVAISDEIGSILKAKISIILIGERPGLSSPDSLGIYLTFDPAIGLTDESRNCISNVRPNGLQYNLAAEKILYLIQESLRLQLSGIHLKDNTIPGILL
jgi:ethanolamine ammonia-lyase small subunit